MNAFPEEAEAALLSSASGWHLAVALSSSFLSEPSTLLYFPNSSFLSRLCSVNVIIFVISLTFLMNSQQFLKLNVSCSGSDSDIGNLSAMMLGELRFLPRQVPGARNYESLL